VLGVYGRLAYYIILHLNFLITSDNSILDRYASNGSSFQQDSATANTMNYLQQHFCIWL